MHREAFVMFTQGHIHLILSSKILPLSGPTFKRPARASVIRNIIFKESPGRQQCYWVFSAALVQCHGANGTSGMSLASWSIHQISWQDSLHTSQEHLSFFCSILLCEYNCQNKNWTFSLLCKYCPLGPRPRLAHACLGLSQNVMGLK